MIQSKKEETLCRPITKRRQTDYQKQKVREANTTHGMRYLKVYGVWSEMKQRCDNQNSRYYYNYGGRGISYDPRWKFFKNFIKDMGIPPKGHSLDRIDNNGNYCKDNCKWSTRFEQMNNTRQTNFFTSRGKTLSSIEWSKILNISNKTLNRRKADGWTDEQIVNTPKNKNKLLI